MDSPGFKGFFVQTKTKIKRNKKNNRSVVVSGVAWVACNYGLTTKAPYIIQGGPGYVDQTIISAIMVLR